MIIRELFDSNHPNMPDYIRLLRQPKNGGSPIINHLILNGGQKLFMIIYHYLFICGRNKL